ncbi:hypothetical protein CMI37_27665 [Candidatus Pacearchaeota archaeon]|nr:hypothetical protein [Candidatus Pacearchaeota archaeon]
MVWEEQKKWLLDDDVTTTLCEKAGNIDAFEMDDDYLHIWKDISFRVQLNKAKTHGLTREQTKKCLSQLWRRPYYLTLVAKAFGAKNIIEVGTAEGLQFYSFAEYASENGGHVWSCDIVDKKNKEYANRYQDQTTFCLGTSKDLVTQIESEKFIVGGIDLFYIDASHEKGAVLQDVNNLKHLQSDNPIWVFDDFDERFGCYEDIQALCKQVGRFKIYRVGNAASGNPNHQAIVFGEL